MYIVIKLDKEKQLKKNSILGKGQGMRIGKYLKLIWESTVNLINCKQLYILYFL